MEKGIKEISEVIDGLVELIVAGKAVMADGKVSIADAAVLMALAKKHQVILAAVQGVKEIPAEVKDISIEELAEIGKKLVEAVKKVQAA